MFTTSRHMRIRPTNINNIQKELNQQNQKQTELNQFAQAKQPVTSAQPIQPQNPLPNGAKQGTEYFEINNENIMELIKKFNPTKKVSLDDESKIVVNEVLQNPVARPTFTSAPRAKPKPTTQLKPAEQVHEIPQEIINEEPKKNITEMQIVRINEVLNELIQNEKNAMLFYKSLGYEKKQTRNIDALISESNYFYSSYQELYFKYNNDYFKPKHFEANFNIKFGEAIRLSQIEEQKNYIKMFELLDLLPDNNKINIFIKRKNITINILQLILTFY